MIVLGAVVAVIASMLLTGIARGYALGRLVDVPNDRSSHASPTPRGGGIAFVATFLVTLVLLHFAGLVTTPTAAALLGAGVAVAAIGFVDDHRHVSARLRLLVHAAAALWALYWLDVEPAAAVDADRWPAWLGLLLGILFIVWLLNLYNFMDGIDALASLEAVTVGLGAAWLSFSTLPETDVWLLPLFLAAAVAGFLIWNWPPARIFMGDVGSGFIGVSLAALALQSLVLEPALFWAWVILLGAFVVDATVTLLRRIARRRAFYEAHRTHAYQHAARQYGHAAVALGVAAINVLWLLPVAWLVASGRVAGPVGLAVAYCPLVATALYFRAGGEA